MVAEGLIHRSGPETMRCSLFSEGPGADNNWKCPVDVLLLDARSGPDIVAEFPLLRWSRSERFNLTSAVANVRKHCAQERVG